MGVEYANCAKGSAMNGLSRETRLQIMLSEEELAAVDDWRFKHRMPSRAAAIRNLLNIALKVHTETDQSKPLRSQDYGLLDDAAGKDE
jgi:hypothetical protein